MDMEKGIPGEESRSRSILDTFRGVCGTTLVLTQVLWYSQGGRHQVQPEDGLRKDGSRVGSFKSPVAAQALGEVCARLANRS